MGEPEAEPGFQVRDRRGRAGAEPAAAGSGPAPPPAGPGPAAEPSLVGLFLMLGSMAAAALEKDAERPQGADLIELLRLLRARTEGRRTPQEDEVLGDLLYRLQLRYVELTRSPGGRPGPAPR